MCGSDGDPDVRYEGVAQMRGQLREARGTMPFQLVWRSAVDHATTVSAGI